MAARKERERRRPPAERRYRFGTPEVAREPDEDIVVDGDVAAPISPASATAARASVRVVPTRSLADFKAEYGYVVRDLRRVAMVVGSLLLALIVLYFVLPH